MQRGLPRARSEAQKARPAQGQIKSQSKACTGPKSSSEKSMSTKGQHRAREVQDKVGPGWLRAPRHWLQSCPALLSCKTAAGKHDMSVKTPGTQVAAANFTIIKILDKNLLKFNFLKLKDKKKYI